MRLDILQDLDILVEEVVAQGQDSGVVSLSANSVTYYIDCADGDDAKSGKSQTDAWRSMGKANGAPLLPGDRLRFKRGCSWNGPLDAAWNGSDSQPIVIGSYGSGELPKIQNGYSSNVRISGSHLVIENLHATLSSPPNPDPNCENQPIGWKAGFSFQDGASYNIVQNSEATKLAIGIFFSGDTHHNKALNNSLTNNNVVWELTQERTLGAMGILLQGDSQEVAYNYIADNHTICTYTGVVESNSIELYAARNSVIHHNTSYHDRVFSEMGSSPSVTSENNTYAYNLHVASLSAPAYGVRFIVTRGWNHRHGPVLNTKILNNTIYLTGSGSKGVVCERCGNDILTLENNILWVNREPFWSDGPFVEQNNLFWNGTDPILLNLYGLVLSGSSQRSDPQFIDVSSFNFNLREDSPAIDSGTLTATELGFDFDLWQTHVPVNKMTDIGAYEYRQHPWQRVHTLPGRIEAEDYRAGSTGYSDSSSGNSGGKYRNDGVDLELTQDESGDFDVGWIAAGEWLEYDIHVVATGVYQVVARVATPHSGRSFRIEIDGNNASGSIAIPDTGGWQRWRDVPFQVSLTEGRHILRFVAESDKFNVNFLTISKLQ